MFNVASPLILSMLTLQALRKVRHLSIKAIEDGCNILIEPYIVHYGGRALHSNGIHRPLPCHLGERTRVLDQLGRTRKNGLLLHIKMRWTYTLLNVIELALRKAGQKLVCCLLVCGLCVGANYEYRDFAVGVAEAGDFRHRFSES